MDRLEWLKSKSTRQLLKWLKQTYPLSNLWNYEHGMYHWEFDAKYNPGDHNYPNMWFTIKEIKSVLATREHVPKRWESRRIRIAKKRKGTKKPSLVKRGGRSR